MPDEAGLLDLTDDDIDERTREWRTAFAEHEAATGTGLLTAVREGFERGAGSSWLQLLDDQPELNAEPQPDLLESATPDTYLAIGAQTTTL